MHAVMVSWSIVPLLGNYRATVTREGGRYSWLPVGANTHQEPAKTGSPASQLEANGATWSSAAVVSKCPGNLTRKAITQHPLA